MGGGWGVEQEKEGGWERGRRREEGREREGERGGAEYFLFTKRTSLADLTFWSP